MERTVSQDTIDELLANRAWLQRLARGLVGSAQVAEDLVQETYESALQSPPRWGSRDAAVAAAGAAQCGAHAVAE